MGARAHRLAGVMAGLVVAVVPVTVHAVVNPWTPIGPPGRHGLTLDSGETRAVAVDPASASVLFAATTGGVYRSIDGGAQWTLLADTSLLRVARVVIDPADSRVVYAAGESSGVPVARGVIKSTDGGDTWTATSLQRNTYDLAIGATPGTLYAAATFEFFRSADGGATWEGSTTNFDAPLGRVAVAGTAAVLVANGRGVQRSTDGGREFELVLPTPDGQTPALAAAADGTIVYAGYLDQLFRSVNGGETWTPATALPRPYLEALSVDPSDPAVVYASTSPVGLFRSGEGGAWTDLGAGAQDPFPSSPTDFERWAAVAIDPHDPAVLYLPSSLQGVLRSTDGGVTWSPLGVSRSWVSLVAHDPRRPDTLFAQSFEGLFRTTNDGAEWTRMALPLDFRASALAFDPGDADRLYAGGGNSVFRTTTGGDVWEGASLNRTGFEGASAVVVDPQQPSTVHAATCGFPQSADVGGVLRSDDAGATWPPGVVFPPPAFARCVLALVVDPGPPEVLYAGGRGGVFASMDGGVSWTPTGEAMENTTVLRLARDPGDPSRLYAVRTNPAFHELVTSADRGATWRRIGTDLPPVAIHDLIVDPVHPSMLYVATVLGVYVSGTAGEHFTTAGLPVSVATLALDPAPPRTLWAGVERRGVLRHRATATCSAGSECEEGDVCTTDRCDPTSDRADLDGCVHDRSALPGVRCALDDALIRVPCSTPQPRIERRIDARLKRAREFVDRAATASRPRRRTIFMRRATRTLSRLVRHLDALDGPSACVDEVRDRIAGIRSTLQALLDMEA